MKIENQVPEEEVNINTTTEGEDESSQDEESTDEASSSEESKSNHAEASVDYAAELARVTQEKAELESKLKKAEFTLYKKNKEERHSEEDETYTSNSDEGLEEKVKSILAREREQYKITLAQDTLESELANFSGDKDRQELIRYHYENTINRRGYSKDDIKKDLETAAFLADRPKFESRISEVNKSIAAEQSKRKGGVAAGVSQEGVTSVTLSAKDKALLSRHGLSEKDIINS